MITASGRKTQLLLGSVGLCLAAIVMFLSTGSASAAFSDIPVVLPDDPTNQQFINLANGQNDAEGNGAFVPSSVFKVYAEDNAGNHTIEFDVVNRKVGKAKACYWMKIGWGTKQLDSYGVVVGGMVLGPEERIQGCTLGTNPDRSTKYSFNIPASRLTAQSNNPGHTTPSGTPIYETYLQLSVFHDPTQVGNPLAYPDPGYGNQTATLRLYIDGANKSPGDGRIGYFGRYGATTYPSVGSPTNILSAKFRAPCDIAPGTPKKIIWEDMDYTGSAPPYDTGSGTSRQEYDPQGRIYEFDPATNPPTLTGGGPRPTGPGVQSSMVYGGSGAGYADLNMKPGKSYELRFENIQGSNGVLIKYPYDSGDFYLKCPPPPTPVTVMGCNRVTVKDDGSYNPPGGANITYPTTRTYVHVTDSAGNVLVDRYNPAGNPQGYLFDGAGPKTWDFTPLGRDVTVQIERQYYNTSVNGWRTYNYGPDGAPETADDGKTATSSTMTCYSATCSVHFDSNVAGKPNGVKGGTPGANVFYARITNTGPLVIPNNLGGTPLSMFGTGFAWGFYTVPAGFMPGGVYDVPMYGVVAPRGIGKPAFGAYLSYNGRPTLEPLVVCPDVAVDVYEPFNLIPRVTSTSFSPDSEDPDSVTYNTQIEHNTATPAGGNPINATSTRYLFLRRGGVQSTLQGPQNDNRDFITVNYSDIYTTPPVPPRYFQVGDQICAVITVDKGSGFLGPNGSVDTAETVPASSEPPSSCDIVENQPFVRSYMGDVVAGGQFEGSGVIGAGVINTYNKGTSGEIGSGVEFAAEAVSTINGFSSAFLRTSPPLPSTGLSFANINNAPCTSSKPGCFRGGRQVRNYFEGDMLLATKNSGSTPSGPSINLNPLESPAKRGQQTWHTAGAGKTKLTNPGAGNIFDGRHDLFVDGDVFISEDIRYAGGPWANVSQIPNFRLFVRGNIYISSDVGQLDGMYVAQPNSAGTGGVIYTCAKPANGDLYSAAELYDGCNDKKLEVNGAFIAQDIKFLRTIYTLSDVQSGCPAPRPRENFGCDHAAESFRLSPDFFLGLPSGRPDGGQNNGPVDDIKSLPPIL